jgi:polysaccharide biosynthesis transport protein
MDPQQQLSIGPRAVSPEVISGRLSGPSTPESMFTWEQALRVIRKNAVYSVIFVVLITAAVAAAAFTMKDFYQPAARIEVDPMSSGMKTLGEIQWNTDTNDENYVDTQTQMLQGDSIAVGVIRTLHLDRNPEFVGNAFNRPEKKASSTESAEVSRLVVDPSLEEQFNLANRTPLESIALASFHKRLAVNTLHNTRVVEISFTSHDAQVAQDVLNALVSQYLEQNFRMRHTASMQASEWLASQVEDLRRKVADANQAVTDFQKQWGLVEVDDRDVPIGQYLYEINHQLGQATANRIEDEAYVRMIDEGQGSSVPAVRDDQLYQTLMARYDDLRAQLARARSIYGDENSAVIKLLNETTELADQVEAERKRMVNQVRTNYAAARDAEQKLQASREKLRGEMGDASSHMTQFRVLKNEAIATSELYETLKGRLVEAGIYAGLHSSNLHVVDLAPKLPRPSGPQRGLIIVMGFTISCVMAVILSFVKESLNNTIRTPDDLKDWVGLPSLAMLPPMLAISNGGARRRSRQSFTLASAGPGDWKVPVGRFQGLGTEGMADLRTALMLSGNGTPPKVILVTSALRGEGKTTVALNLAAAFAQCGNTCLLDADLRQTAIANAFGLNKEVGLQNVLTGSPALDNAITSVPEIPGLSLVAATVAPSNPLDIVASPKMRSVTEELRNRFEYVVIDSPPVISYSDARILSSHADVVIVVGRYEFTTRRAITRCTQILDEAKAPVLGAVVNGIDLSSPDYHYYNYGYRITRNGELDSYERQTQNHGPSATTPSDKENLKSKGAHA